MLPALVLNYFGQGALLLSDKTAIENPFFRLVPGWGLMPLVLLSTAATVIASQAVISGSFSLTRQAIQLGLMPQLDIFQTSTQARGQIYIPQVNWLLLAAVLALVVSFKSSSALASAYGFAVTGTMALTTVLAAAVMRGIWRWRWPMIGVVLMPIMTVDLALFGSNSMKIPTGAWFPLVIGLVMFTIMSTWRTGRRLVLAQLSSATMPLAEFLATCEEMPEARVSGTAVFLTSQREQAPGTLVLNLKHNKVLHRTVLLVRVMTDNVPLVARPRADQVARSRPRFLADRRTFRVRPDPERAAGIKTRRNPRGRSRCMAKSPILSAAPTSNRHHGREWPAGASISTCCSAASPPAPPSFSASPPDQVIELGAQVEI